MRNDAQTKPAADEIVKLIRRSRLIDDQKLDQALANLEQPLSDSGMICSSLINAGLLTPWQTDQLLSGRCNGFFLSKYKLLDKLGSGGMSQVYLAEHLEMGRRVAIKVLTGKRAERTDYLDRFRQEARAAARVDHPNIVRAFDVGHEENGKSNIHFLVMEFIDGIDLQRLVEEKGTPDFRKAANYVRQAATGLAHVHRAGLIHRDIKPANLLVDKQGVVKIVDLGLARLPEETLAEGAEDQVLGTVDYLAPEQSVDSHNVSTRADIYCLGCVLYFLLTGRAPFPTGTLQQRVQMHRSREPESIFILRPDVPPALVAICQKMIEKSPDDRYQTADEVVDILQAWQEGKASRFLSFAARRPSPLPPATTPGTKSKEPEEDLTLAPLEDDKPASERAMAAKAKTEAASDATEATNETATKTSPEAAEKASSAGNSGTKIDAPTAEVAPAKKKSKTVILPDLLTELSPQEMAPLDAPPEPSALQRSALERQKRQGMFPIWLLAIGGVGIIVVLGLVAAMLL